MVEFIPNLEYNITVLGEKNMEYLTSNEIAQKWNISSRRVRILCGEGRVEGAIQKGILWLIPSNTQKPQELRRGSIKRVTRIGRGFSWRFIINPIIITL